MLPVFGWFPVPKPLSQKRGSASLPLQDTAPTPSFGGFGLKQVFSKTESESGYHEAWAGILPPRGKVLEVDPGPWITSVLDVKRFAGRQPLEADFCVDALREALGKGKPEVFNAGPGGASSPAGSSPRFFRTMGEDRHGREREVRGVPESLRQRRRRDPEKGISRDCRSMSCIKDRSSRGSFGPVVQAGPEHSSRVHSWVMDNWQAVHDYRVTV